MRLSIDIPDETHRELKAKAASQGLTISEVVRLAVEQFLRGDLTVGMPEQTPARLTRPVGISKADQAKGKTRK